MVFLLLASLFPLRIFSVNVTKAVEACELAIFTKEIFTFFVLCSAKYPTAFYF